jgi:hypothetical protein
MSIFDVVVNTDDLVVLGPPNNIDLSISIGEQGPRGATFFVGSGNPNISSVSENVFGETLVPIQGDLYINVSTGSEYGWLYIYNPKITGDQWDQVLRIQPPSSYFEQESAFINGVTTISLPLSNLLPSGTEESNPDNYIVNITPIHSDPISFSIRSKTIASGNLNIELEAVTFNTSTLTWALLGGSSPGLNIKLCINVTVI